MTILQYRRWLSVIKAAALYQPKDPDLDAVAASGVAAAWAAYTPTITAGTGTFTTVSRTGNYLTIGKLTFVRVTITITTNGTAATNVVATLPNTATGLSIIPGRENSVTGKLLQAKVSGGTMTITNHDDTYPGGSGYSIYVNGSYESA